MALLDGCNFFMSIDKKNLVFKIGQILDKLFHFLVARVNFLYSFICVYFKTFKVIDSLKKGLVLKIDFQKQRKTLQQVLHKPDGMQMHIFQDKTKKLFPNRYSIWYLNVKNSFTVVALIYKSPSAAVWSS